METFCNDQSRCGRTTHLFKHRNAKRTSEKTFLEVGETNITMMIEN